MKRDKKIKFKEFVHNLSQYPYNYLVINSEEFKEKEKEAGVNQTKDEKDKQEKLSLLQYLQYAKDKIQ